MLVELSVVEQRYQAVLAVIRDGVPIVEVAQRFDVSRQAVHRWLRWYEHEGLSGLVDRSHRPPRCSHQMDPGDRGVGPGARTQGHSVTGHSVMSSSGEA